MNQLFTESEIISIGAFSLIFFVFSLLFKKTVLAVLDRLVNPHWPYLPKKSREVGETNDRIERAWSSVPDDPLNYEFFYHVLEADDQGKRPKIDEHTVNEMFNPKSVSCLWRIAESGDKVPISTFQLANASPSRPPLIRKSPK